jgi:hypothetical protein
MQPVPAQGQQARPPRPTIRGTLQGLDLFYFFGPSPHRRLFQ